MTWSPLWKFIDGHPEKQYELFKIVLDKGALALLIVIAGLITTLLIERYKSLLNRQSELNKIFIPQIVALLEESETLYEEGNSVILKLADEFRPYTDWLKNLLNAKVTLDRPRFSLGPECRDDQLDRPDGSSISLCVLLAETAPDDRIRNLIQGEQFWTYKSLYGPGTEPNYSGPGLLSQLETYYSLGEESKLREAAHALAFNAMAYLFAEHETHARESYFAALRNFRLKVMRTLEPRTRKQKKIYSAIVKLIDHASETIEEYPADESLRIKGASAPPTAQERLTLVHAGLVNQLRIAIRRS